MCVPMAKPILGPAGKSRAADAISLASSPSIASSPSGASIRKAEQVNEHIYLQEIHALAHEVDNRRRIVDTALFLLYSVAGLLLWGACTLPYAPLVVESEYDETGQVAIVLSGCDVRFVSASAPRMAYHARLYSASTANLWMKAPDGAVIGAQALNAEPSGCRGMPFQSCQRICELVVGVPAGAPARFVVTQRATDVESEPLVSVEPGTSFGGLQMGFWWNRPPTASLDVRGATIGDVEATLASGSATVDGTHVSGTLSLHSLEGSVYVLDHPAVSTDVRVPSSRRARGTPRPVPRARTRARASILTRARARVASVPVCARRCSRCGSSPPTTCACSPTPRRAAAAPSRPTSRGRIAR